MKNIGFPLNLTGPAARQILALMCAALLAAGDPVMFARRARLLFEDPSLAARIGAAGREAATILAPQSVAPRYAALYASL